MGAKILVENTNSDWAEISFCYDNKMQTGYVPTKHIVKLDHKVKDWVEIAQILEGTPYKWGGRDTIGIDCSAYYNYPTKLMEKLYLEILHNKYI